MKAKIDNRQQNSKYRLGNFTLYKKLYAQTRIHFKILWDFEKQAYLLVPAKKPELK